MTASEYRKEITYSFNRNTDRGFVDYYHCGRLVRELTSLLERCQEDLLAAGNDKDLFSISLRVFKKWSDTNIDDSNGDTETILMYLREIWESVYERQSPDIPHNKMYESFMKIIEGSKLDFMIEDMLNYVMDNFNEPQILEKKLRFLYQKIEDIETGPEIDAWGRAQVEVYKQMVMRIYSEQGCNIEFIRSYARGLNGYDTRQLMADIELKYGYVDRCIKLYEGLAEEDTGFFSRHTYDMRLKDLYKEYGFQDKYESELAKLLYLKRGNPEILEEFKTLVPADKWPAVRDNLFDTFDISDSSVFSWYESEGCFDRLMAGVEACGYDSFKRYAGVLKDKYPERCLAVLVNAATEHVKVASNRNDYKHIARVLRWIGEFPGGPKIASALAQKFRSDYPRKTSLIEELAKF